MKPPTRQLKPLEPLMTLNEVLRILRISRSKLYGMDEPKRFKVGGRWMVRPSELQRYLSEIEG